MAVMQTNLRVLPAVMTVYYFGQLIALVNDAGEVLWRNPDIPMFLIEYLIQFPTPDTEQARRN